MFIKQIAVASDTENGESMYALSENGKLYEKRGRYIPVKYDADGKVEVESKTIYWWEEINWPIGDPSKN